MARSFASASTEYLSISSSAVFDYQATMVCWFNVTNITADHSLMCISDTGSDSHYWWLAARGSVAGDPIYAQTRSGSSTFAKTTSGYSANTWHHAAAIYASDGDIRALLDGGSKGTAGATYGLPESIDSMAIGALLRTSAGYTPNGMIAEAAIYNIALSDAEVLMLAKGYSPLQIRPDALLCYWPLGGIYGVNSGNAANGDIDIVGGYNMNPVNTPSVGDHPSVIYHNSGIVVPATAGAVPPSGNPWYYYAQQEAVA